MVLVALGNRSGKCPKYCGTYDGEGNCCFSNERFLGFGLELLLSNGWYMQSFKNPAFVLSTLGCFGPDHVAQIQNFFGRARARLHLVMNFELVYPKGLSLSLILHFRFRDGCKKAKHRVNWLLYIGYSKSLFFGNALSYIDLLQEQIHMAIQSQGKSVDRLKGLQRLLQGKWEVKMSLVFRVLLPIYKWDPVTLVKKECAIGKWIYVDNG